MESERPAVSRAALIIVLTFLAAWLLSFHTTFLVPDSSGTYAWARSLLYDRDLDFRDELDRLGGIPGDDRVRFHALTDRGRPGNPFGMGSGLLWMPFLLIADAGLALAGGAPAPRGYTDLHVLAVSTGSALYGLAALLLGWRVARRLAGGRDALAATLAVGLGTPFLAYAVHLPTYAHVNAAFAAALVLVASCRARRIRSPGSWALAGAAAGLAAVVRAQGAAMLAIPLALWIAGLRGGGRRGAAAGGAALTAGFAAAFSPQAIAWLLLYGDLRVPQGEGFLDLLHPHLAQVLLSPWNGLFPCAPVLLLAIPGLLVLGGRDRPLASGIALAAAAQIWLVASVPDWWGGYAIGARRLVDLTPLFLVCLAPGFGWLRGAAGAVVARLPGGRRDQGRARRWATEAVAYGAGAVAMLWSFLVTVQVRTGLLRPHLPIAWGELLRGQGIALRELGAYLASQARASRWEIHLIVHQDSPVRPRFDAAPDWLFPVTLGLCWALGLAVLLLLERRAASRGTARL